MALGVNPYTGTKVNYIQKIIDQFDGAQIGDSGLVNDDIFAIFPLIKAGYTIEDEVIEKTVNFILDEQKANGSFSDSIDLTASGIQALVLAKELNGTASAVENAKNYLLAGQQSDGGFGSSFSTSWALQAIDALGDSETEWLKNAKSPKEYLASLQQSDGGLENENEDLGTRVWATAYAIPGFYGKPWSEILLSFSKQEMQDEEENQEDHSLMKKSNTKKVEKEMILPTVSPEILSAEQFLPRATYNFQVEYRENIQDEMIDEPVEELKPEIKREDTNSNVSQTASAVESQNKTSNKILLILGSLLGIIFVMLIIKSKNRV